MADYIDRQELLKELPEKHKCEIFEDMLAYDKAIDDVTEVIKIMPAADVVPVVHGRWISGKEIREYKCSNCEFCFWHRTNYCPECGAKMKTGGDSE